MGQTKLAKAVFNWGPRSGSTERQSDSQVTTGGSLPGYGAVWDCEEDVKSGTQGTDASNRPETGINHRGALSNFWRGDRIK